MAGRPGLKRSLARWVPGVLLAHALAIDWAAGQLQQAVASDLQRMPVVMYTRVLAPVAKPPPPVQQHAHPQAGVVHKPRKPVAHASLPLPPASAVVVAEPAPPPAEDRPAEAPTVAIAQAPAPPPAPPASQPASAAAPAPALDTWPTDSRLNYRLGGQYRSGPLFGDARVLWQRDGTRYQVRVDVDITLWAHWVMASQGDVGADGLAPRVYEEERRGHRRAVQIEGDTVTYERGRTQPRPAGVQDTASQFVELGHRFATGAEPLQVGKAIGVWLARPGGVDRWTYDIVGMEPLALGKLGTVTAYHLKPRPIAGARGNITAEFWYAPSLQYLPVRVRINMGETDYLDLTVESIEQR